MDDDARRRIRRAMLAKRATSPKLRGQYQRSIRAKRLEEEARRSAGGGSRNPKARLKTTPLADVPPPRHRHIARWILLVGLLPVLLIGAVGAYAINVVVHTERAANKIAQDPLPRANGGTSNESSASSASSASVTGNTAAPTIIRPTNTPNARGTIAPLPTTSPIPTQAPSVNFDRKDPFTIMMLGVDTRDGDTAPSRSDTIIIAYVDPDPAVKSVHLLSIPRDLLVTEAGGGGQAKMSDVYADGEGRKYLDPTRGGIALVRDTIELNFRIRIDYYAQVDFEGFTKIIDTIGGVTVDNPYPIKDDEYPTPDYQYARVFFPAGTMHLYGAEALEYARTRHDDNDYARNARQQQVLLGVRQQALQLNLLPKATSLIDALGDSIRTDLPPNQWAGLAKFGTDLSGDHIQQFNLLTDNDISEQYINGVFYTVANWPKTLAYIKQFSPKENKDYLDAQARQGVNVNTKIVVENGTRNGGLANRWAADLRTEGYTATSYIDAPPNIKGNVTRSKVLYFTADNEKTATALAKTLNLRSESVDGSQRRPAEAGDADIVILLGDDAREPSAPAAQPG